MIRLEMRSSTWAGSLAQFAVMASWFVTARRAILCSYIRSSPMPPAVLTGSKTANACQRCV